MSLEFPVPYTEFVPRGLKKQAGGGGEGSNMQWQKQTSMIIKMILALYVSYVGMYISKASCNYHIVNKYIYVVSNFCRPKDVFVLCCVCST